MGLLYWLIDRPAEQLPPSLQPFSGFNFTLQNRDRKHGEAIELPDVLVAAIVFHYANESTIRKEQAKKSLMAFSGVGIRSWLQVLKGEKEASETNKSSNKSTEISELVQVINGLTTKLNEVTDAWENYPSMKTISQNQYLINRGKLLPPTIQESFTIRQLLNDSGIELTNGQIRQIGIRVAQTYRSLKGNEEPNRQGNNCLYDPKDYGFIVTILRDMGYLI